MSTLRSRNRGGVSRLRTSLRYRNFLIAAAVIFLCGVVVGLAQPFPIDEQVLETGSPPNLTAVDIAVNNLIVGGILATGAITFGGLTVLVLFSNGLVLGVLIRGAIDHELTPFSIAQILLPHAVFELPGLFIAAVIGFASTHKIVVFLFKDVDSRVSSAFRRDMITLGVLSVVLIVIGALIESEIANSL